MGFPSIRQKVVGAACQLAEAVGVVTDWLCRGEPVEDTTRHQVGAARRCGRLVPPGSGRLWGEVG